MQSQILFAKISKVIQGLNMLNTTMYKHSNYQTNKYNSKANDFQSLHLHAPIQFTFPKSSYINSNMPVKNIVIPYTEKYMLSTLNLGDPRNERIVPWSSNKIKYRHTKRSNRVVRPFRKAQPNPKGVKRINVKIKNDNKSTEIRKLEKIIGKKDGLFTWPSSFGVLITSLIMFVHAIMLYNYNSKKIRMITF